MQDVGLPVEHHRVPRVVSALVAGHDVGLLREQVHDFAFALVVGILVGTYSSIYVASPVVLALEGWAHKGKTTAKAAA